MVVVVKPFEPRRDVMIQKYTDMVEKRMKMGFVYPKTCFLMTVYPKIFDLFTQRFEWALFTQRFALFSCRQIACICSCAATIVRVSPAHVVQFTLTWGSSLTTTRMTMID